MTPFFLILFSHIILFLMVAWCLKHYRFHGLYCLLGYCLNSPTDERSTNARMQHTRYYVLLARLRRSCTLLRYSNIHGDKWWNRRGPPGDLKKRFGSMVGTFHLSNIEFREDWLSFSYNGTVPFSLQSGLNSPTAFNHRITAIFFFCCCRNFYRVARRSWLNLNSFKFGVIKIIFFHNRRL